MSLLLTMLPVYIFGNLHCIGMCGPLVMMLGHHRYRYFYFAGRAFSFTLAGMLAGELGAVLNTFLQQYHISAFTSFLFGGIILLIGIYSCLGWQYPGFRWISHKLSGFNKNLSLLMLKDQAWPTFLFGFFTVFLPCGQTLLVFSACALAGDLFVGMVNGFAFATLTTPALWLAMHAHTMLHRFRRYYDTMIGLCGLVIGGLAICRGMAEMGWIAHWVLNPAAAPHYHVVIY